MSEYARAATDAEIGQLPPLEGVEAAPPSIANPAQPFGAAAAGGRPTDGFPMFEMVPRLNKDGTYSNIEMVSIVVPGDPKNMPRHKVTEEIKRKYPQHYDAFRRGLEMAPVGAPLEMWPVTTPAVVRQLKAVNIFTVEQLAEVPDSSLHQIPMGMTLRNQAKEWLKSKKEADLVENRRRENEAMKDGMRMMEDQLAEMGRRLEEKDEKMQALVDRFAKEEAPKAEDEPKEAKRGPGRPRKE